jgi:uncharacterized protein YegP (UPF0339 family)
VATQAHFVIYMDAAGRYRWRLRATNSEIIADSGQGYATNQACREAIQRVKYYAAVATLVDISR